MCVCGNSPCTSHTIIQCFTLQTPSVSCLPCRDGIKPQNDEDDMGMTYEELGLYGRLRKVVRCGPVAMFRQACQVWRDRYTVQEVAEKVRNGTARVNDANPENDKTKCREKSTQP